MDSRTGEIYPSKEAAVDALAERGVSAEEAEQRLVTGPLPALRHLSRMVKRDAFKRRRVRQRMQKASRKAHRRG